MSDARNAAFAANACSSRLARPRQVRRLGERDWHRDRLPEDVRQLVIDDQERYHRRMTMLSADDRPPTDPDLSAAASLFRSLSDPTRLSILRHLQLGEHRVRDLTEHLGLAQSTVSAHLACLKDCGLVASRPQARASVFSLAVPDELLQVLAAAERLLETTGYAVDLCPVYGSKATGR